MSHKSLIARFKHWKRKIRWNRQYKKGKWAYLTNSREDLRYQKIIEYIRLYGSKQPVILDLGSGEAILNSKLDPNQYLKYYNVDYSDVSIKIANRKNLVNAENVVADIHTYNPDLNFDIIIFNEAFYYVNNDLKVDVLNRFVDKLKPNGILIISIYKEGLGCWNLFDESEKLKQLNFETVNTDREQTYWKVGAYQKV